MLDASALLATLHREPGADRVAETLPRALMSSVNWSEVLRKALTEGISVEGMRREFEVLGLTVLPFGTEDAELAATLWTETRHLGLSHADRACIATGIRAKAKVLTADRSWIRLDVGVRIEAIRRRE